jgi:membrane protease YdiL (CAAX protease family)
MTGSGTAQPHALPGTFHAPAGMLLPPLGSTEAPRAEDRLRNLLDVAGGVAFAWFIGLLCMRAGGMLFHGVGWAPESGWESVWLIAAMLCSPLMPSAIRHDISIASTLKGLLLDWPELIYATWILGIYTSYIGTIHLDPGPVALALAVGTAEEFIFRVLLLGWLVGRLSVPAALAVSATCFGLAHLHEVSLIGILSIVPQTAGGFVLGAVYLRTRNPLAPILCHAYWDFPYFMAMGGGVSGGSTEGGMPTVGELAPWMVFMVYGLWLVRHGIPVAGRVSAVGAECGSCGAHERGGPAWSPRVSIDSSVAG